MPVTNCRRQLRRLSSRDWTNLLKWSRHSLSPSSTGLASNSLHTFLGEGSLAPHSFAKLVKALNTVPQISHVSWFLDQVFSALFFQHFLSRWPFQLCCSTCRYTEHLILISSSVDVSSHSSQRPLFKLSLSSFGMYG